MAADGMVLDGSVKTPQSQPLVTWGVTIAACVYFAWSGTTLYGSVGVCTRAFASMGVEMSPMTMLVITSYRVLLPLVFGVAMVFVIAKQFFVRETWTNLAATLGAVFVTDLFSNAVTRATYGPLFELIEKLSR